MQLLLPLIIIKNAVFVCLQGQIVCNFVKALWECEILVNKELAVVLAPFLAKRCAILCKRVRKVKL